jgi:hypothetical protein
MAAFRCLSDFRTGRTEFSTWKGGRAEKVSSCCDGSPLAVVSAYAGGGLAYLVVQEAARECFDSTSEQAYLAADRWTKEVAVVAFRKMGASLDEAKLLAKLLSLGAMVYCAERMERRAR